MTTKFDHPDNEEIWFTVKEDPKMRDILMYDSVIEGSMLASLYPRLWGGVRCLVDEWNCETVNPEDDTAELMDGAADMGVIDIIKWAGLACFSYRQSLEPEKN